MQFNELIPVGTSPDAVNAFLQDTLALLGCLPNCREVAVTAGGGFKTVVEDRVGPFRARMTLTGSATVAPDGGLQVQATGTDPALGSGVSLSLRLTAGPAAVGSVVELAADVQVRGKLASLGLPIFNLKAKEIMRQFAIALRARLEGGSGG